MSGSSYPLRCGPSGDTASAAAKRLTTTGRVLPVVNDRLLTPGIADASTMPLTSWGFRRQTSFIEGFRSIGVHLIFALGLSNEPGPPHPDKRLKVKTTWARSSANKQTQMSQII